MTPERYTAVKCLFEKALAQDPDFRTLNWETIEKQGQFIGYRDEKLQAMFCGFGLGYTIGYFAGEKSR